MPFVFIYITINRSNFSIFQLNYDIIISFSIPLSRKADNGIFHRSVIFIIFFQIKHVALITVKCLILAEIIARCSIYFSQSDILSTMFATTEFQQWCFLAIIFNGILCIDIECSVFMLGQLDEQAIVWNPIEEMNLSFHGRNSIIYWNTRTHIIQ